MGIRIHKSIGYALTDVIYDEDNWTVENDGRFDPDGWMMLDCEESEERYTMAGFKKHIEALLPVNKKDHNHGEHFELYLLLQLMDAGNVKELYSYIIYDMEFGAGNVLMLIPPGNNDWVRYDDIIDYYDPANRENDGGITESIIPIDRPIWPYESYNNLKTMPPTALTGVQQQFYNTVKYRGLEKYTDQQAVAEILGLDTPAEFETHIAPVIPLALVEMLKYVKMFKDERTIYELRPIIYGYWG